MYQLIQAEERHIDQLVPLLASTGYWDFGLKHNTLSVSNREFMREAIVKPHLFFTDIIAKEGNDEIVLGAVVSGTKEALSKISNDKYDTAIDPKIVYLFKNLFNFEITDSYHISFLAVSKSFRGKGLGERLLKYAEMKGNRDGYETLSLYTASCQTSAIKLYHRFGMMITKVITVSERVPFPYFLYFEKNKKLMTQHDYFDTKEYQTLDVTKLLNETN
jgi:ribosomal protein S18 acetylase RimI-like enzyme